MSEKENLVEVEEDEVTLPSRTVTEADEAEERKAEALAVAEAEKKKKVEAAKDAARKRARERSTNSVRLVGTVVKTAPMAKGGASIVVCCPSSRVLADYPRVLFFKEALGKSALELQNGTKVEVSGHLQVTPEQYLKPYMDPVFVVGDSLTVCEKEDKPAEPSQALDTRFFTELGTNVFDFSGRVEKIRCRDNHTIVLSVSTGAPGFYSTIDFDYPAKNMHAALAQLHVWQYLRLKGVIQTMQVPLDGTEDKREDEKNDASVNPGHANTKRVKTKKIQIYILQYVETLK